ncbi:MAG TPA: ribosomal protein S18-alanine N-acetyltransferase [Candidatus Acidoferrum sp.]|nr:ribosomal protein S18-alanine N-acetyltransferase [Candidatus Acidoferrum sp.]
MQETYSIRKFNMNDLQGVMQINRTCLPENYTDFFFLDLYRRFPETFIVAEQDGEVVGYIMCRVEVGLSGLGLGGLIKKGHVVSIAISSEHRRKGIGEALVSKAMEAMKLYNAKQSYLEVRVTNDDAIRLYKKLGFEVSRTMHGYYADGEDAHVMTKKL